MANRNTNNMRLIYRYRRDGKYYIQSACSIADEDKMRQELKSFRKIDDSFRKIVIVGDDIDSKIISNLQPFINQAG